MQKRAALARALELEYRRFLYLARATSGGASEIRLASLDGDPFRRGQHRLGIGLGVEQVDRAARAYPWKTTYKLFPGPNSNTFTAWIAKQVPELELDLPFSAIGSGYVN